MSLSQSGLRFGLIAALVLACGLLGWAVFAPTGAATRAVVDADGAQPDPELTVEALKSKDPGEVMRMFRRDDLTEEQREQLRHNAWEARREMMDERMNRYFTAEPEDRNAILDEQIDEFLEMRQRWEAAREQDEQQDERTEEEREKERQQMRERWQNRPPPTREERKEQYETARSENRSRMMTYFQAVRARMQERGIESPRGPWGRGGGGPRGGFGGGRGGPRGR
jgi:hypothetical protein